ncbi:MAG: L-2-hydroxyglutarate oxidase [Gammaproteobacteria bacterium]|nr:L-2-hydroxyglutarate oxidase [Gammaproteobacteria bacterium]MBT8110029.1 L-2-hydroxyglutarate oxidase [Gammaproteobacteria bacterium]NNL44733.1 L-2-hydroxyglutarate oxidase [Woeseiaceae bacterium]
MYDYVILGGGIVGISTAWQLKKKQPDASILLLEKESRLASHQSGHSSGVIHAGAYYAPGSLKAKFCKTGAAATIQFCAENDIPFEQCGKLLVATNKLEHERMLALFERAKENGLDVELIDADGLHRLEPNISGIGAVLVKSTGIVDYRRICQRMAEQFQEMGGEIRFDSCVTDLRESADSIEVSIADAEAIETQFLITCAGLNADRATSMLDIDIDFRIIPFRGEYYRLAASKNDIVKHLIYPIPDPDLPFLGVHLTRMIDGSVTVGPNAVQGWKREGYGRININVRDVIDMLRFPGFWKVALGNLRTGLAETRDSLWKPGYLKRVQKYCPSIRLQDLEHYPAGIRAQAVLRDGTLVHDFLFAQSPRSLHVCNAPSPAATSAIPIGEYICDKVAAAQNPESAARG